MKQYIIMKRYPNGDIKTSRVYTDVYDENTLSDAINICNDKNEKENKFGETRQYKYFVAEMVPIVTIIPECDMSEDELKEYTATISKMDDDLNEIIDYDEWAYREYGETKVDYWYSAKNLYNAGYRKITKIEE